MFKVISFRGRRDLISAVIDIIAGKGGGTEEAVDTFSLISSLPPTGSEANQKISGSTDRHFPYRTGFLDYPECYEAQVRDNRRSNYPKNHKGNICRSLDANSTFYMNNSIRFSTSI
jgi:hypothetical protein